MRKVELFLESIIFQSRWALAPFYLGLALSLLLLLYHFLAQLFAFVLKVPFASESDVILGVLSLIDLAFTGNLVVIVIFSGYENFVSRIDAATEKEALGWLGKLDSGTLKLKVAASIVAISSIHLLRRFMEADELIREGNENALMWFVIIHLTFVVSAVMMGVLDRITSSQHRGHKGEA
jgi:uncharacterized protein (TIGR00645 family)